MAGRIVIASPNLRAKNANLVRSRQCLDFAARVLPRPRGAAWPPKLVHVALLWGLGDAVTGLPLLQGLKQAWPDARIVALGKPWLKELFQGEPIETRVLEAPWTAFTGKYRLWNSAWRRFLKQLSALRRESADLFVSYRLDPREVMFGRISGARAIAGIGASGGARWMIASHPADLETYNRTYVAEIGAQLAQILTAQPVSPIPAFSALRKVPGDGRSAILAFGTSNPLRRWPIEKIQAVADGLLARGWRVTAIDDHAGPLPSGAIRIWSGSLDALKQELASADLFVGADSGPAHVASALGVPTIAVFGGGWIERFALRRPSDVAIFEPIACRPCFDICPYPTPLCLDRVTPDQVLAVVDRKEPNR